MKIINPSLLKYIPENLDHLVGWGPTHPDDYMAAQEEGIDQSQNEQVRVASAESDTHFSGESCTPKKILFTADLHLNIPNRHGRSSFDSMVEVVNREQPDAVVIAGDLSTPHRAATHLAAIHRALGERPLAITLGNHDFWTGSVEGKDFYLLENTVEEFWAAPCRDQGITLLDRDNAIWGNVVIAGGYGHFDLGLAWPDLHLKGQKVTEEIYMKGEGWNDFRYIPKCAEFLKINARAQAAAIAARLDQAIATNKRILMATHTCTWAELNGHPRSGSYTDIFTGYGGNSLVGHEIEQRSKHVEFLMCGHTHYRVPERLIHGIPSINVGTDYGVFRGVIYDTTDRSIRWVGAPVPNETP